MRKQELEFKALELIKAAAEGRPVEDALVELKTEWPPDSHKMARRLAGHANAARGSSILWLIGVNEKSGEVLGAERKDAAQWYPQLEKEFDGPAPSLFDIVVHYGDKTLMALAFETDRAPYVIKNAAARSGETQLTHEVPWREGTRVRTARREDLIRMLVPASRTPTCDVLSALMIEAHPHNDTCRLMIELFLTPRSQEAVCIPFRDIRLEASWPSLACEFTSWRRIEYPQWFERILWDADKTSPTVRIGAQEALLSGPGTVFLCGEAQIARSQQNTVAASPMNVRFHVSVVGALPIVVDTTLPPSASRKNFPSAFGFWG